MSAWMSGPHSLGWLPNCFRDYVKVSMQDKLLGQRAQTQSRFAREPIPLDQRAAYSPAEFAALFGRSPTWGYRQIYAGRVRPIADCGRLLIPYTEVDSILARRCEYNPAPEVLSGEGCEPGLPTPARKAGAYLKHSRSDETTAQPYRRIGTVSSCRSSDTTGGKR